MTAWDWDDPADVATDRRRQAAKEQDLPNPDPCDVCRMWGHQADCRRCGTPAPSTIPAAARWLTYIGATPARANRLFTGLYATDTLSMAYLQSFGLPGHAGITYAGNGRWHLRLEAPVAEAMAAQVRKRIAQIAQAVPSPSAAAATQRHEALEALWLLSDTLSAVQADISAWAAAGHPNGWASVDGWAA